MAGPRTNPAVLTGIGDDCAVLRLFRRSGRGGDRKRGGENDTLVTTDFTLEGIHFRRDWHSPESVGHRCLARGLSDIAAMGGEPVAAFLSLALPRDLPPRWVRRFARSLISLAERYGVTLAGGDTSESPNGILADIVVVGTVPKAQGRAALGGAARRPHLCERRTRRVGGGGLADVEKAQAQSSIRGSIPGISFPSRESSSGAFSGRKVWFPR